MSELITNINMNGNVDIKIFQKNDLMKHYNLKNCIVTNGCYIIASLFSGSNLYSGIQTLKIGTGTTPTKSNMNSLVSVYQNGSVFTTHEHILNTVVFQGTFSSSSRFSIRELGLFNADSTPKMFSRVVTPEAIVKNASETMIVTWTISFNPGC